MFLLINLGTTKYIAHSSSSGDFALPLLRKFSFTCLIDHSKTFWFVPVSTGRKLVKNITRRKQGMQELIYIDTNSISDVTGVKCFLNQLSADFPAHGVFSFGYIIVTPFSIVYFVTFLCDYYCN